MENISQNRKEPNFTETGPSRAFDRIAEDYYIDEEIANNPNSSPEERQAALERNKKRDEALQELSNLHREELQKRGSEAMNSTNISEEKSTPEQPDSKYVDSQYFVNSTPESAKAGEPDRWINPKAA